MAVLAFYFPLFSWFLPFFAGTPSLFYFPTLVISQFRILKKSFIHPRFVFNLEKVKTNKTNNRFNAVEVISTDLCIVWVSNGVRSSSELFHLFTHFLKRTTTMESIFFPLHFYAWHHNILPFGIFPQYLWWGKNWRKKKWKIRSDLIASVNWYVIIPSFISKRKTWWRLSCIFIVVCES